VHEARKNKELNRRLVESEATQVIDSISQESEAAISPSRSDDDFVETDLPQKKMKPSNIITFDVSSSLDQSKVSDRNAVYVLAATAKSLGLDPKKLVINRESIRQARRQHRGAIATEVKLLSIQTPYSQSTGMEKCCEI
jgi:hypothetical protein